MRYARYLYNFLRTVKQIPTLLMLRVLMKYCYVIVFFFLHWYFFFYVTLIFPSIFQSIFVNFLLWMYSNVTQKAGVNQSNRLSMQITMTNMSYETNNYTTILACSWQWVNRNFWFLWEYLTLNHIAKARLINFNNIIRCLIIVRRPPLACHWNSTKMEW